jgi:furin
LLLLLLLLLLLSSSSSSSSSYVSVSHSFGYGLMDAYAMVKLARNWKTVPEQHKCEVSAPHIDK